MSFAPGSRQDMPTMATGNGGQDGFLSLGMQLHSEISIPDDPPISPGAAQRPLNARAPMPTRASPRGCSQTT